MVLVAVAVVAGAAAAAVAVVEAGSTFMRTFPNIDGKASLMNIIRFWSSVRRLVLALILAVPLAAVAAPQETFATPEAAVDALMAALKADSDSAMIAILGEENKDLIIQTDRAAASATRAKALAGMQTLHVLKETDRGSARAVDR